MKNDPRTLLLNKIHGFKTTLENLEQTTEALYDFKLMCKEVTSTLLDGNKILIAGNGGSANDASHIATELTVRFEKNREPYRAIALTTDVGSLTATANDYSFNEIFSRQIKAVGNKDDVFLAISTSGKSPNILNALKTAKEHGLKTILMTGDNKNTVCSVYSDVIVSVPSSNVATIQELHRMYYHALCQYIEGIL